MSVIIFITTIPRETGIATFQLKAKQLINFFGAGQNKPAQSGWRWLRAHSTGHWPNLKASSRWILMEQTQSSRNKTWEKGAELFLNFVSTVFTQLRSFVFHRMAFFSIPETEKCIENVLWNRGAFAEFHHCCEGLMKWDRFTGQAQQSWLNTCSGWPQHFTTPSFTAEHRKVLK